MATELSISFQTREVGTIFNYNGKFLRVEEEGSERDCLGCFFCNNETAAGCYKDTHITGLCYAGHRSDGKGVRFVYVPDDIGYKEQIKTTDASKALSVEPTIPTDQSLTKRETVALEFAKAIMTDGSFIHGSKEAMLGAVDTAYEFADYFLEKSGHNVRGTDEEKNDGERIQHYRIKRPVQ